MGNNYEYLLGNLVGLLIVLCAVASWFTHVFHCISNNEWLFLIAGAIMFPIAWVHGLGLWIGVF